MSELTQCNYCTLRGIRRRYKGTGSRVLVRYNARWGAGGANIYVVPKDVRVPKGGIIEDSKFHDKYSAAWFMEISNSCAC